MKGHVAYELRGDVAWITLDRPEALNALSRAMRRAVGECCERADRCEDARVVVVRAAGGRAFSVGADIKEFNEPASGGQELIASGRRWHDAVAACRKPVIAAIDGYCLGGGLELALACDIRVCTAGSVFALPEVGLGVIPGAGGTQRLPRLIGVGPALRLILTGERIDAAQAQRLGLVTDVVADVDAAAAELAATLARNGQLAMAAAKAAVRRGLEMPLDGGLALEAELSASVMGSPEQVARAEAFAAKRVRR